MATLPAIPVHLTNNPPRHYDIIIHPGLLQELGSACRVLFSEEKGDPKNVRILVVTDETVAPLYLSKVQASLKASGFSVFTHIVPAGEASKSLQQAEGIYQKALKSGLTRKDVILALGGGVIGDLAGFCAATYHRGIGLIHVPTTLVAQVDSAIGGKTAVNVGHLKNMAGVFYQPLCVLSDVQLLETLPLREFSAGMAEVIKYGLIETACTRHHGFFDWLILHQKDFKAVLPEIIQRCAAIKASVVMQDELETLGLRFYLNLGHTFAHAYETLSDYQLLHGEAVAIGLLKAVCLAAQLELIPASLEPQLLQLYEHTGLLSVVEKSYPFSADSLLAVMKQDKKNHDAPVRLILPVAQDGQPVGQSVVRDDISEALILKILAEN